MSRLSRVASFSGFLALASIVLLGSSLFSVWFASTTNEVTTFTTNFYTGWEISSLSAGAVSVQSNWNVPTASSCNSNNYAGLFVGISTGGHQDGAYTLISCPGKGGLPSFTEYGEYKGNLFTIGSTDVIKPGDKLSYKVDFTIQHSLKITLVD